jgi:NADH dehydrogenase FAD-containing subunit
MKRLVLLGGGHAHVHVLAEIAREPMPGVQAVLVTPFARQIYSGMVPGWVAGHYAIDDCAIALEPLARAARVEFALASATAINAAERTVTLSDGRVAEYDVLSVDVGAQQDRDGVAGARTHGLFVRPIEHFVKLYESLLALAGTRVLDIVVIGGGAAGFEIALGLRHRLQEQARVCLVSGDRTVLPSFDENVQRRAVEALRRARVTLINQRCTEIGDTHVQLDNGARLVCDVLCRWRCPRARRRGCTAAAWRSTRTATSPPGRRCRARRTRRCSRPATRRRGRTWRCRAAACSRCAPARHWR